MPAEKSCQILLNKWKRINSKTPLEIRFFNKN